MRTTFISLSEDKHQKKEEKEKRHRLFFTDSVDHTLFIMQKISSETYKDDMTEQQENLSLNV